MTEKPTYAFDIEMYPNVDLFAFKRLSDGKTRIFELSDRSTVDWELLRNILLSGRIITYNGMSFDIPVTFYAIEQGLSGVSGQELIDRIALAAQRLISGNVPWWNAGKTLDVFIPRGLDHVDLIEPQPNAFASLKILNGRMHGRWMRDLPYHWEDALTHEQIDRLREYNINDLDATESLWNILQEPIDLRVSLGSTICQDLRSKSDTQVGLAIIKKRCENRLDRQIKRGTGDAEDHFRYEPPAYVQFDTPELQLMLERLREHDFIVNAKGKVDLPAFLTKPVRIGETEYAMGIGGLHSTESNRALYADDDYAYVDADVRAYYPNIILSLGLYPADIGPVFLDIYREILDERAQAKANYQEIKRLLKKEDSERLRRDLGRESATEKGLKIAANGTFGSLGSPYSIVYSPRMLIAVTITGQLALLVQAERAERAGIRVVSANTDGLVFRVPREMYDGIEGVRLKPSALADLTEQWERDTGFDWEFNEYRALLSQSVNSYIALKTNGGHKRKGPPGNPWNEHPDDWNPFYGGQLMKNPQATIVSDAVLAKVKSGVPLVDTIMACRDIRQFVTVIKVTAGATWRGDYLGKVVRYYWGTDGDEIIEAKPHATTGNFKRVPKTHGASPCMTLPDEFPDDIDYERYIAEAEAMLRDIGFYGTPLPALKRIRITKANRDVVLREWAVAA